MQHVHHPVGQDGMTSTATSECRKTSEKLSCTPELVAEDRNQTWSDRLRGWLDCILEPKSSGKLAAVSTSKDQSSLPYWSEFVQGMSEQLWSLTGIGSAGLNLSSLSGTAINTVAKSWFSVKQFEIVQFLQGEP
jgi:putative transposase